MFFPFHQVISLEHAQMSGTEMLKLQPEFLVEEGSQEAQSDVWGKGA